MDKAQFRTIQYSQGCDSLFGMYTPVQVLKLLTFDILLKYFFILIIYNLFDSSPVKHLSQPVFANIKELKSREGVS